MAGRGEAGAASGPGRLGLMRARAAGILLLGVALSPSPGKVMAAGDPLRGRDAYESRCGGCHSVDSDRVGPRHAGVAGRRAGSVPGYVYSDALRRSKVVWNAASLERWLESPERLIPGQRMGYSVADADVRADIVAYLLSLGGGADAGRGR